MDDTVLKARGYRSIIAAALRQYKSHFWAMLKALWPWLLASALLYTAVLMLTVYEAYFFVPLAIIAELFEVLVLWLMATRWLTRRPVKEVFRLIGRHWILLFFVALGCCLILKPLTDIITLPAIILALAQWNAMDSLLMGDAPSMPSYVVYLAAATWLITLFISITFRLLILYIGYYAWGSAEAKRRKL